MPELKILLVDHSELFRQGLALLINNRHGLKAVAQCADAGTALTRIAQQTPDVIIVASDLPKQGCLELIKGIPPEFRTGRVLILADKFDARLFRKLMSFGSKGYLLKSNSAESLMTAIQTVAVSKAYLDSEIVADCLDQVFVLDDEKSHPLIKPLSPREEQVLKMWACGTTSKSIAEQLNLSSKTIDTMRARAFVKLRLRSRADAINYALKEGWLSEDS